MKEFENKTLYFNTALKDVYRDEENRELPEIPKMELKSETLTEDFTAMLYGMSVLFSEITGNDCDIIEFTHILNKLAIQHLLEENGVEL